MKTKHQLLFTFFVLFVFFSCQKEDEYEDISPVSVNLSSVPYEKLSDYHFYKGILKKMVPNNGLHLYRPASELFTDYAVKTRYVWLPQGTKATYVSDMEVLELPVGSVLIKNFYFDRVQPNDQRKIIETRLQIRKNTGWIFATYKWNEEQTEAYLETQSSTQTITWLQEGQEKTVTYTIPNQGQCTQCHTKEGFDVPLGIKPQNLNYKINYGTFSKNQLEYWIENGLLGGTIPENIQTTVDFNDTSKELTLRVRSYFDSQCAHCHTENGPVAYLPLKMAFHETLLSENMGICVTPTMNMPGMIQPKIIKPNDYENSTLHHTLTSNNPNYRMPRIGRNTVHAEGVALIEQWINSLENCQ